MVKKLLGPLLTVTGVFLGALPGCNGPSDPWKDVPGGAKRVLVSFPPLFCFAKQVAGTHAKVLCLAVTVGPHHYEPTPEDALKASKADLILYNGHGLDDEKIKRLKNSSGNSRAELLAVGEEALAELKRAPLQAPETKHGDHTHEAGPDPHIWLGPQEAGAMVKVICQALQRIDPDNGAEYQKRAESYIEQLKALHSDGKKKLSGKSVKLITTHDSLRYLARNFDLKILGNIQIQPGIEADSNQLQKLVEECLTLESKRAVITTEPQYPRNAAEILQRELRRKGCEVALAEVDTLETAEPEPLLRDPTNLDADYYLAVMRKNIANLAKALE